MSFGASSLRPAGSATCPCGRAAFRECCGPLLDGAPAPSAERLMRSRYTAFAVHDADHLARTWHPRTRPAELEFDDTVWEGLVVEDADEHGDAATVAFRAAWRRGDERGAVAERSRFLRRAGRWVYVDGDST
ncbi:YchJ family protein [Microbacterium sp.]|uniref:YchJ family protein n=1 Tax=Microbacterium sp. TaxID=51671 RepID=UPI0037CC937D